MWEFKQYTLDQSHYDIVGYIPREQLQENEHHSNAEQKQSEWSKLTQEDKDFFNRQRAGYRMKSKIRRSIIKHDLKYMWTLTFRTQMIQDGKGKWKDMSNLSDVWSIWTAFIKRCHRKELYFRYIVIVEVQEKRLQKYGEKVYHFHFATDTFIHHSRSTAEKAKMKYKEYQDIDVSINMMDIWGHGHCWATNFSGNSKISCANYLTKYITKAFGEITQKGVRRYRISEGLEVDGIIVEDINTESAMDEYVFKLAKKKNCFFKRQYHCISGGEVEIIIYTIFPKTKNKKIKGGKKDGTDFYAQSNIYGSYGGSRQEAFPI